jgi:hypothetical protein
MRGVYDPPGSGRLFLLAVSSTVVELSYQLCNRERFEPAGGRLRLRSNDEMSVDETMVDPLEATCRTGDSQ